MKKLCLLIAGIAITSITAFAQEGTKVKNVPDKKTQTTVSPVKSKPLPGKKQLKNKTAKKPLKVSAVAAPKK